MTLIRGRSERGRHRNLWLNADQIQIRTPSGRSGVSVLVNASGILAGADRLVAHWRGDEIYLWIRGVGANGWSIYVPAADFERVRAELAIVPA